MAGIAARRQRKMICLDCDRVPVHLVDAKYACRSCGQVVFDPVALIMLAFGPGVERVITKADTSDPVIHEGWIERWLDL